MIDTKALSAARKEYAELSETFWDVLKNEGAIAANRKTEAADLIIKHWTELGGALDLLLPLLEHETESVRYGAAAHLLKFGAPPEAIKVLKKIATNSAGFISPTARLLLMKNKIPIN